MAEDFVNKIDLDGEQWDLQDTDAQQKITDLISKVTGIEDTTIRGSAGFEAKRKYIGEDSSYKYYIFWFPTQSKTFAANLEGIQTLPNDTAKEKIIALKLNVLQSGNANIYQKSQHISGANNSGFYTYFGGNASSTSWQFSGFGVMRVAK